ncbi:zinc-binding dehydrogenase [Nonomuraea roseoviolacea]|uniref:NADPH2:quinone reductase n=1 Tax=Nonomuraea roseoviolacea subsp. carminata TaxID=160689 RepID=A0ABT1KDG7_9ACTN|nr:zinc-binding dehydrogenase [Nonomuraea roseoviolacea]MCP2351622.1 NADPH2:quinone reductase [Nonomuraea roseoviolacea subsp. carminata]
MRSVVLPEFGPPDRLRVADVPEPRPGEGQVTVRVAAIGVQFLETQIRSGAMRSALGGAPLPVVLGKEIAGRVAEVGPGGDPGLVGTRVLASTQGTGGYAEAAAVPADSLIPVPAGLDLEDAVALYRYGATAQGLVRAARVTAGDRVLVLAAAGAVGMVLVQVLKRAGATVVGAARGEHKLALVRELGADHAVDYSLPGWPDLVRRAVGGSVEVVFDHVGGEPGRASLDLLTPGSGRQVVFGLSSGRPLDVRPMELLGRGLTLTGFSSGLLWNRPALAHDLVTEVLGLAVRGHLTPVIGRRFPLERAADAHAAVEARGTVGKTLLIP